MFAYEGYRLVWSDHIHACVITPEGKVQVHSCVCDTWDDPKISEESGFPANWNDIHAAQRANELGLKVEIPKPTFGPNDPPRMDRTEFVAKAKSMINMRVFNITTLKWQYPGKEAESFPSLGPVRIDDYTILTAYFWTENHFQPVEWMLQNTGNADWYSRLVRSLVPQQYHQELDEVEAKYIEVMKIKQATELAAEKKQLAERFGLI